uniref:Uncharacterized protein n=1 Tax=Oryza sativa subsp. japonica TaxID=39947 RepID=Q2QQR8_ORYSJ|nr:hypothetical protein LOC_Os12g30089 [Oryza sativa Japonica Group]
MAYLAPKGSLWVKQLLELAPPSEEAVGGADDQGLVRGSPDGPLRRRY